MGLPLLLPRLKTTALLIQMKQGTSNHTNTDENQKNHTNTHENQNTASNTGT